MAQQAPSNSARPIQAYISLISPGCAEQPGAHAWGLGALCWRAVTPLEVITSVQWRLRGEATSSRLRYGCVEASWKDTPTKPPPPLPVPPPRVHAERINESP